MARALAAMDPSNITANGGTLHIPFLVYFYDTGGARVDLDSVTIALLSNDTEAEYRTKLTDAIVARATALDYSVARQAMMLPDFQRGSLV